MIAETIDIKAQFLSSLVPSKVLPQSWVTEALDKIELLDFPTSKEEYWKYTRPTKIVNSNFTSKSNKDAVDASILEIPGLKAYKVVLVNGFFRADLSELSDIPTGVKVAAISASLLENYSSQIENHEKNTQSIFTQINTAYATGGVFIEVSKDVVLKQAIHIVNLQTSNDNIALPRNFIVAHQNASVKIVLNYKSTVQARTFTNAVNEIVIKENARIDFNKLQNEQEESLHLSTDLVYQEANSYYNGNTLTLNGSWVRNNVNIIIDGPNCESRLYGLYPLTGHQHVDNHTLVDHRKPHSNSSEWYKGILDGNSNGVFNGKVFVRKDAQKTNAFQQNSNIILSDSAQVNTKPELEIYADDVKCSHGCTTGQFDDEAVFYLRARGISEKSARNMLVYAFAEDVINNITIEPLKDLVHQLLANRFNWEQQ